MLSSASKLALLFGLVSIAMMLGSSCYQLVVDVPNWSAGLPASARAWAGAALTHATPTRFYEVMNIFAVVALVGSAVTGAEARAWKLMTVALLAGCVVVTVIFVFPRNDVLFFDATPHSAEQVAVAARQWRALHVGRIALLAAAVACAARGSMLALR